jgi:hypothetical protein
MYKIPIACKKQFIYLYNKYINSNNYFINKKLNKELNFIPEFQSIKNNQKILKTAQMRHALENVKINSEKYNFISFLTEVINATIKSLGLSYIILAKVFIQMGFSSIYNNLNYKLMK